MYWSRLRKGSYLSFSVLGLLPLLLMPKIHTRHHTHTQWKAHTQRHIYWMSLSGCNHEFPWNRTWKSKCSLISHRQIQVSANQHYSQYSNYATTQTSSRWATDDSICTNKCGAPRQCTPQGRGIYRKLQSREMDHDAYTLQLKISTPLLKKTTTAFIVVQE